MHHGMGVFMSLWTSAGLSARPYDADLVDDTVEAEPPAQAATNAQGSRFLARG